MRLIDADAMEKTILDFWGCDPAYCMDLNGWDPAMADVCTLERLKNAPTVDAVPVVRAKWEWNDHNGYYYCEKCGGISPRENQDGEYCDCPPFCPYCGAKMEAEKND